MSLIDYKELLIKYIRHIQFNEGIDYLDEVRILDSGVFSESDIEEINKILAECSLQ